MDIDRLNSNQAVCRRLVELIPWENFNSRLLKPFYKDLCGKKIFWSCKYTPGGLMDDNSCYLVNKNYQHISSNMTDKAVYESLRAYGLRHKKTLKLIKLLESLGAALSFSLPIKDEGLAFYKGDFCILPDDLTDEITFPLLFSFSEWVDITRETNSGFDNMPLKKRHRLIFNTIRHNITIYDEMADVTNYGGLARKIGEAVISIYPVLHREVLSYWERKEKLGVFINSECDRLPKPNSVLCGMDSLKNDFGEFVFSDSELVA